MDINLGGAIMSIFVIGIIAGMALYKLFSWIFSHVDINIIFK